MDDVARDRARAVLLDHQHTYEGGCYCGQLGASDSYIDHLLDELHRDGVRLVIADRPVDPR